MQHKLLLEKFYAKLKRIHTLSSIHGLLGWDQQVNLPLAGAGWRAQQLEFVSSLHHEYLLDVELKDCVDQLLQNNSEKISVEDKVNLIKTRRKIEQESKLPKSFVEELERASSTTYNVWVQARPKNDFAAVKPHLTTLVRLYREHAKLLGHDGNPYNALLDIYEPEAKIEQVRPLLLKLGTEIKNILPKLVERFAKIEELKGDFEISKQYELCRKISSDIGYDYNSGRLDKAAHPFEANLGAGDVRITTRFEKQNYLSSVLTCLHEAGHALYEMGFLPQHLGTPMGSSISLGIHESQSRLWENIIGRSQAFAEYIYGQLKDFFPNEYKKTSSQDIWNQLNLIRPSLIRVEADEVTYSQHIIIRMLLEEELANDRLEVADLPQAWKEYYKKYLDIEVCDHKDGVMQDVHWYSGSFGYFPTYALGNLYSAQMFELIKLQIPNLDQKIRNGNFLEIKIWLNQNVHQHGMKYSGSELIKNISGKDLSEQSFVNYLKAKF